jgi:predicted enzyme related to lactoylglutathione lyase
MSSRLYTIVIDAHDVELLAEFWAAALGYQRMYSSPEEIVLTAPDVRFPGLILIAVPEGKVGKNRVHLDLNPDDRDAEVERLIGLGATRADIGQTEVPWIVMADPEGNEFCVLNARPHDDARARPNLEVRDVAGTAALLADWFGFTTKVAMTEPMPFAIVGLGIIELGLLGVAEPSIASMPAAYLTCQTVDAWHERCVAAGAEITSPLTTWPWGMKDFVVRLPEGHQLAVGERVSLG